MDIPGTPRPRILILTIDHGASHRRAADALRKALLEIQPQLTVEVVDALEHCTRWFRAYYNSYELPLKYWPALWGWIENLQYRSQSTGPKWLYRWGARPLFRFIQAFDPDAVVAAEVGICELAALFKRKTRARFLLVGLVLMDFGNAWAQPEVDLYPVAPSHPADDLERAGVPSSKILPCGTPIDPVFASLPARRVIRARLGVEDAPLLLVLFGGTGFGRPRQIVRQLSTLQRPFQAVFITGKNRRMEEEVRKLSESLGHSRVLGWVDNMHEWMTAADLLVSKPGGTTLSEAFVCGLPILAFDPLPGNERRTCALLEQWGVGHWVKRPEDLAPTLERLLADGEETDRLRRNALARAYPQAARDAAQAILKSLSHRAAY